MTDEEKRIVENAIADLKAENAEVASIWGAIKRKLEAMSEEDLTFSLQALEEKAGEPSKVEKAQMNLIRAELDRRKDPHYRELDEACVLFERFWRGRTLGELIRKYGVKTLHNALGGRYIFHCIGPDEPEEEEDNFYDEIES